MTGRETDGRNNRPTERQGARAGGVLILIVSADIASITSRSAAQFAPEFDPW